MLVKVFFLGRPGSGKTTAIQEICDMARRHAYTAICMDDYNILSRMSQEDTQREKFRTTDYGGFDVLDPVVFDTALEVLEQQVQTVQAALQTKNEGIITIEFARDDYHQALSQFSPGFLKDAYIFFIEADLNTCIQRIYQRVTSSTRRHFVSTYIMHTYYSKDNWTYVIDRIKKEYDIHGRITTYCNTGSLSELLTVVNEFADHLFTQEFGSHRYSRCV